MVDIGWIQEFAKMGTVGVLCIAMTYMVRLFTQIQKDQREDQNKAAEAHQLRVNETIAKLDATVQNAGKMVDSSQQLSVSTGTIVQSTRDMVRDIRDLAIQINAMRSISAPPASAPKPPGAPG